MNRDAIIELGQQNGSTPADGFQPPSAFPILYYWKFLGRYRVVVTLVPLAAVVATFVITRFYTQKQYRATAMIMPTEKHNLSSTMGSLLGGDVGALMSLAGGSSGMGIGMESTQHSPEEIIATLKTYSLSLGVADKCQLRKKDPTLTNLTRWRLFKTMGTKFSADYDLRSKIVSIYYIDPDPRLAQTVLGAYIDELRARFRNEQVQFDTVAISSLRREAAASSDPLLGSQLYSLLAQQIEDQKEAEMNANFALKVIEPPVTPEDKYSPLIRVDCLIALFIALSLVVTAALVHDYWRAVSRATSVEHPAISPVDTNGSGDNSKPVFVEPRSPHYE